jgi:hypothetical protein
MLEPGRRVVVAFAVSTVLFGIVGQQLDVGGHLGVGPDRQPASAVLADVAPVGVVPAATRSRTSLDGELSSASGSTKTLSGLLLILAVLVLVAAVHWWHLLRADHRLVVRLQTSSSASPRAPPAFA